MTGQEGANPRLAAALRYAQADWPVFPCIPGEKAPATKHGFLDATTDPDKITWWWSRNPERNVAIATGAPGPDVLDVDVHKEGSGFAAFNRLHREGLLDGASAYIRTPSGGLHAYFAGSEQGNGRLPRHHLDFRSKGGYVIAPPSHVNGRHYELIKRADGHGGLDWAAVTRLLEPERQQRPLRSDDRSMDAHRLAEWVARQAGRQPERRPVLGRQPGPGSRTDRPRRAGRSSPEDRARRTRDRPHARIRTPPRRPPLRC